jgi:aminomethyltransferase
MRAELYGLRRAVALVAHTRIGVLRVGGEHAFDVLDRLLPCDLFLRDGQLRPTCLLDTDGTIVADVTVVAEDDAFWLLVEGVSVSALAERVRGAAEPGEQVEVEPSDTAVIGVEGPIAWELLGAFDTPGIGALPHLALARLDDGVRCLRISRTGEYGYQLLVPAAAREQVVARLHALGEPLGLVSCGLDAFSHALLENGALDIHAPGQRGATPVDLQLQWRVSRRKPFPGADALAAQRTDPHRRRMTGLRGPAGLVAGQAVTLDERVVGTLLTVGPDFVQGGSIALAHLDLHYAHPGIDRFRVNGAAARTVSLPFVQTRSLWLRPGRQRPALDTLPFPYPA